MVSHLCGSSCADWVNDFEHMQHMMTHTDERPYLCCICSKSFTQSAHLKEHSMLHTNAIFTCDLCGKGYYQPQTLRRHKKTHNASNQFQCEDCGFSTTRAYLLTDHMRKNHSKEREMRYQCTVCPKAFYEAAKLNKHMIVHTPKKDLKATETNPTKSLSEETKTENHLMNQSLETEFKSPECKRAKTFIEE